MARRCQAASTQADHQRTSLVVPVEQARARIDAQFQKGQELLEQDIGSQEHLQVVRDAYYTWRDYTSELLKQICDTNELSEEFTFSPGGIIFARETTLREDIDELQRDLRFELRRLASIRERLDLFSVKLPGSERPATSTNPIRSVERIARRFHAVARQLRHRHADRPTLEVEDEYDVQDLLHALLKLYFDDVRPEEWTPSYAGGSARVDFLLKTEQTVVEVKKTRAGLGMREVGDQLLVDIGRYRAHPDCKTLVCFVYDPEGRIANPNGLETDLSRPVDGMRVKTIVSPKGQ